ncbi:MAG: DUF4153 domain-containing protein [Prevotellaceae bacterium]|nr:DUF4153 domain-containing protein [Prevotellaceae bacterium]
MPVSVLLVVGLTVLALINTNVEGYEVPYRWWVFCSVGLLISVAAALWLEDNVKAAWRRYLWTLAIVACGGVYSLLLPQDFGLMYFADWLQVAVLGVVFFLASFFISFLARSKDYAYWQFGAKTLLQMVIAGCFGGLLLGGLCLAALSIEKLFSANIDRSIYINLWTCCMLLFTPLYFLANISGQKEKHSSEISAEGENKILKTTGLYILTPLLAIYALILYIYLLRIVATWALPDGWVSWLVSALAIGGLLLTTIVYPMRAAGNRLAEWLSRYSGIVILPLLVLMTVGIGRRISDYGISINRCYILLLNIWFYGIYIYLFITKAKHIKWILISPVVIILLASVGPWKFSSVTKRILLSKVETVLDGRTLTLSNSAPWLSELNEDQKLEIREALDYLAATYGKGSIQAFFKDDVKDKSMYDIFADLKLDDLKKTKLKNSYQGFSFCSDTELGLLELKEYQSCITFSSNVGKGGNKIIEISVDSALLHVRIIPHSRSVSFPIKDLVLKRINNPDKPQTSLVLEALGSDSTLREAPAHRYLLVVTEMFGGYDAAKDSLSVHSWKGVLFYK